MFKRLKKKKKNICTLIGEKYGFEYDLNDMSEEALYDATRGIWKRRLESVEGTDYCLSVFKGEVVEVYKIDEDSPFYVPNLERLTIFK